MEPYEVVSAHFNFEQKTWELFGGYRVNALLLIYDVLEDRFVDYVTHWMDMPELPERV